jgi:hypothetical protein
LRARRVGVLLLVLAASALAAAPATADGDPASDVLIVDTIFVPFQARLAKPLEADLRRATTEAARKGYPIRVALIEQPADLGAVPSLFGKPQTYAQFLWQELSFVYKGNLLVVMPQGFGFYSRDGAGKSQTDLLERIPLGGGLDGMAASALNGVIDLAAAAGHRLSVPKATVVPRTGSDSSDDRIVIGAAVGGAVLLAAALVAFRRWRPRR